MKYNVSEDIKNSKKAGNPETIPNSNLLLNYRYSFGKDGACSREEVSGMTIENFTCRVCRTSLYRRVVHLPAMPLTDDFIRIGEDKSEYLADIDVYHCPSCGLVQNPKDFDYSGYYEDYEYSSGHSKFVQNFMQAYAKVIVDQYSKTNDKPPASVIEIGSGDGEQLLSFKTMGVSQVLGIEPSASLVRASQEKGIPAIKDLFGRHILEKLSEKFDICVSSYTLDHVWNPSEYLDTAYSILNIGGFLVFEVHDLERIIHRAECCLFAHEHTLYLDAKVAEALVVRHGFIVVAVNPLHDKVVRANSLIVLAKKVEEKTFCVVRSTLDFDNLQKKVNETIDSIDEWLLGIPENQRVIGYGAGGRGVMTLAALRRYQRFSALFDSNFESGKYLTPKTRIPVLGTDRLEEYRDAYCLVFSFGYFDEIKLVLIQKGFIPDRILSLSKFYH
ncbi:MAG TPA: class I SAM-dependent methyltransferase [Candidatus Brocadiaceae bacterium]